MLGYMSWHSFLESNLFQTLVMFLVGLFAFVIYFRKKRDDLKNAATIIKLEIDNMETAASCLPCIGIMGEFNMEDIYKTTSIYQSLEWFKVRNLFIGNIDIEYISAINDFYESIIVLEDARSKMKEAIHCNRISKVDYVQKEIVSVLAKISEDNHTPSLEDKFRKKNEILNVFNRLYDEDARQFVFNSAVMYYQQAMETFQNLSNTVAYDKLKNIANKGFLKFW